MTNILFMYSSKCRHTCLISVKFHKGNRSVSKRGLGGDVSEIVMRPMWCKQDHDTYICSCRRRREDINKNKYHMAHSGPFVFQSHHLRRGCCGKRMGGGITCDWAGTPAGWSWYLPGSAWDQGRSEQSASSVTLGLWGKWRGRRENGVILHVVY